MQKSVRQMYYAEKSITMVTRRILQKVTLLNSVMTSEKVLEWWSKQEEMSTPPQSL